MKTLFLSAMLLAASGATQATTLLTENFDDISTLAGDGWVMTNASTPPGETGWFQGNDGVFSAHSGAADSYIAANFLNAGAGGSISNWLITPELTLNNTTFLSFYTRRNDSEFFDNLEVLFNTTGGTDLGDFSGVGTMSVDLTGANYPTDWVLVQVSFASIVGNVSGRLAFHYFVDNTDLNGDYIGIDDVAVNARTTVPVPEPLPLMTLSLGLVGLAALRRKPR